MDSRIFFYYEDDQGTREAGEEFLENLTEEERTLIFQILQNRPLLQHLVKRSFTLAMVGVECYLMAWVRGFHYDIPDPFPDRSLAKFRGINKEEMINYLKQEID